jgi:hypothetical protein
MTTTTEALPQGINESDLKMPSYKSRDKTAWTVGDNGTLTLYHCQGFGWVIVTLLISGSGRLNNAPRYYGIRVSDGAAVRVGRGPHVTRVIRVYIRQSRVKALSHFIQLYNNGMVKAHSTRDRISSRRYQGQVERAAGRRSWRWDI